MSSQLHIGFTDYVWINMGLIQLKVAGLGLIDPILTGSPSFTTILYHGNSSIHFLPVCLGLCWKTCDQYNTDVTTVLLQWQIWSLPKPARASRCDCKHREQSSPL